MGSNRRAKFKEIGERRVGRAIEAKACWQSCQ